MDSLAMDSLSVPEVLDSLELTMDTIVPVIPFYELWNDSNLTDIEMRALDWSLRWLDTTDCVALHDTTTLPDSVYKARLQALPCVIELPYNERVRAFIHRYVKRSPKQVARLMRMSEYYFPIFEEALDRYGLPYELKYVPIIESALNPMARSMQEPPVFGSSCREQVNCSDWKSTRWWMSEWTPSNLLKPLAVS